MTGEELKAQLAAVKEFRAARISDAKKDEEEAQRLLDAARGYRERWEAATPHEVIEHMAQEERDARERQAEDQWQARVNASHQEAVRQALKLNKGILASHAGHVKSMSLGFFGLFVGGVGFMYAAYAIFEIRSEIVLMLAALPGAIGGLLAGYEVFNRNFVVDESLERSPFDAFTARKTVASTYFKSRR
jgi:hypothetical protein